MEEAKRRPTAIQIDDDKAILSLCREMFDLGEIDVAQFTNKADFMRHPSYEADVYLLDRNFPANPGEMPNDTSWREVVSVLGEMYPEKPVFMLSGEPPEDKDWRRYTNIVAVIPKPMKVSHTLARLKTCLEAVV